MLKRINWASVAAWALGGLIAEAFYASREERAYQRELVAGAEGWTVAAALGECKRLGSLSSTGRAACTREAGHPGRCDLSAAGAPAAPQAQRGNDAE